MVHHAMFACGSLQDPVEYVACSGYCEKILLNSSAFCLRSLQNHMSIYSSMQLVPARTKSIQLKTVGFANFQNHYTRRGNFSFGGQLTNDEYRQALEVETWTLVNTLVTVSLAFLAHQRTDSSRHPAHLVADSHHTRAYAGIILSNTYCY